jgi:cation diffusion facilitator CzcD-associated flavoprotein CzcO
VSTARSRWDGMLRDRRWLAAAAVVLIAASSAVTVAIVGAGSSGMDAALDITHTVDTSPTTVQRVSDDYERLDRELASTLAASRDRLQPETVEKVERNLAIIDAAIAEIRQALAEDPGNDALLQLLKASYGQKSALVRQVSAS